MEWIKIWGDCWDEDECTWHVRTMNFEGPEDGVLWANLYPPKTLTLKPYSSVLQNMIASSNIYRGPAGVPTEKKGHMKTQREGSHLKVMERGLRRNETC